MSVVDHFAGLSHADNGLPLDDCFAQGSVVSLGQAIVDVSMQIDAIPDPGEDLFANHSRTMAGGCGFNVLYAARAMGARASLGSTLGNGPWADILNGALAQNGIEHAGMNRESEDSGFCVALTDENAERTFISTRGAECHVPKAAFDKIYPSESDVVHFSGYTLVSQTVAALLSFLGRTCQQRFTAVFDVSPVIEEVDWVTLNRIIEYRPIWTCNENEADLLASRLEIENYPANDSFDKTAETSSPQYSSSSMSKCYSRLAQILNAPLVVHCGSRGAWLCLPDSSPQLIPAFSARAVDTNGAGDCHTGVLCASLLMGIGLREAVSLANLAASISVESRGAATCPPLSRVVRDVRFKKVLLCDSTRSLLDRLPGNEKQEGKL